MCGRFVKISDLRKIAPLFDVDGNNARNKPRIKVINLCGGQSAGHEHKHSKTFFFPYIIWTNPLPSHILTT